MAFLAEQPMADGIDPLMHPVHPPGRSPLVDEILGKPEMLQLPEPHDPVLPCRQLGSGPVRPKSRPTGRFTSI
jgi:hypothetical protein